MPNIEQLKVGVQEFWQKVILAGCQKYISDL